VLITAYSHYAPVVLGLQLDKATAKLEAEGVPLAGIDVVNAPSPELVNQVIYQGMPDEARKSDAQGLCSVLPGERTADVDRGAVDSPDYRLWRRCYCRFFGLPQTGRWNSHHDQRRYSLLG
jgi:hypothetical protein